MLQGPKHHYYEYYIIQYIGDLLSMDNIMGSNFGPNNN